MDTKQKRIPTPGKWVARGNTVVHEETGRVIASCDYQQTGLGGSKKANAELMALTPRMVALLQDLKKLIPPDWNDGWNNSIEAKYHKGWKAARELDALVALATNDEQFLKYNPQVKR